VLVDGRTMRSCLMLAPQAEGAAITTIEGLASGDALAPLQQAFWDCHGLQCGFCTPGILMTLTELLHDNPNAGEEDIRLALSGHLCRCTGYQNIVAAALAAAEQLREKR
jgi:carbon-monoxide dehydrogenase small subunit